MDDLISRQAAIDSLRAMQTYKLFAGDDQLLIDQAGAQTELMMLPSAQPEPKWIPVKMRPMDSGEREYWEDQLGEKLEDKDAVIFDCPMPEDGQEILVSYRKWISMDECEIVGGCYGLEGNGDWEGVIAWMPLPEAYKGEES